MGLILSILEEKKKIIDRLRSSLDRYSQLKAEKDHHSRRKPRPCGMTIHTGIGCSYGCTYCYIYDMGFPGRVQPYPLSPLELVYALSLNPYIVPRYTLAAYGSVTEPFLPETSKLAIEYIKNVYKWLKLPSQVSTKSVISNDLAKELYYAEPNINVLITLVTLERYRELEPRAPQPRERLKGAKNAIDHGLKITLFLRPIIPGVTDREAVGILKEAADVGIESIVLGSLRVTPGILKRLESRGIDTKAIIKRLPRYPRNNRDQVTIKCSDIKKRISMMAKDMGFKVFETACAANIYAHNEYCYACDLGPCGNYRKAPRISESDIYEYLEFLKIKHVDIEVKDNRIVIFFKHRIQSRDIEIVRYVLTSITRKRVSLRIM